MAVGRERLRDWIKRSGLNQRKTAELLGFHEVFLSQILLGIRRPGLDNALAIERNTGIPVESWQSDTRSEQREPSIAVAADARKRRHSKA